jgi:hypothetical protein
MRVNKPSWDWIHDNSSGWSFKVGEPHLDDRSHLGHVRTRPDGEYALHVFAAKWKITQGGRLFVSSRSPKRRIDAAFGRLDGIQVLTIELHRIGWVRRVTFDEDTILEIEPLSWADSDNVANWIKCTQQSAARPPAPVTQRGRFRPKRGRAA